MICLQIEKIPLDEIKKELKSAGVSEDAVEELLHVLSINSLTKLEGILFCHFMNSLLTYYFFPTKNNVISCFSPSHSKSTF